MKPSAIYIAALILSAISISAASLHAGESHPALKNRHATAPYGDFCPLCSAYGMGKSPVEIHQAMVAIKAYFGHKGYAAKHSRGKGRFIVIDIYEKDTLVDRVLFDRHTGRLRSVY